MNGAVVVRYDENGEAELYVYGGSDVRLFIVDERAKDDRVYEWLHREKPEALRAMIGNSQIGSSRDSRHEAIANRITNTGKKRFKVVP